MDEALGTPRDSPSPTIHPLVCVRNVADADSVHRGGGHGHRHPRLGPEGRADHSRNRDEEAAAGEVGARRQAAPLRAQDQHVPEQ